ncbi:family 20 glycosylhydrolase [Mycetocola zhadangensis]|uniref:Glycosyl hydrolase family 20 n=1 Tax=Mycetocola zhadangensis TaxID=1164595 RepID=A0A3L7J220_9MICO|nr:family 20 glycosylhydrolase [Mycetocola zhadangensis]RLQ84587.1 glycosyl hydrolase family 20 [Mycetocola zhadangensis]GGE91632.1 hypothetical protein GCM10011313_13160 [Mycetocola zhadangensis]
MKSSIPSRTGRVRKRIIAGLTAAAFAFGGLTAATPATAAVTMPAVIPSIDGWAATTGTFTAADNVRISVATANERLTSIAGILRDELAVDYPAASVGSGVAPAGGIELRLDASRADLGDEGYDLKIGSKIVITAAKPAGAFYGTRTILQMLTQQDSLPQGSLVDVPEYVERGVTVCACVINISPEFIDRLIEEMAFLKLNTMLVELKVKVDAYPETNTWSYYTKDDIETLVEKANAHGIDVIPEINSPGHMEIWLENLPELQLTNQNTGVKDEVRMDITQDAAFNFYTDLIDEYSEVFTSDYWHMGVDEYMLGSGYANYPQIKRFAEAQFGAGATENDVVAWYVNKVNDYVKSQNKKLRIWNDGVMTTNRFVTFDTDIIVEHWNPSGSAVKPQQFLNWGHQMSNISNSLYMVRGSYGVNSQRLYEQRWTPEVFYDQTITSRGDQIRGARMSIWPDGGTPNEAENTTEQRMFEPLRFVAQATWSGSHPWSTFAQFRTAMDTIGHSPLWDDVVRQPLANGTFTLTGAGGEGALTAAAGNSLSVAAGVGERLNFTRTNDGYYTIRSSNGRCLDLARDGTMRLDVPVEIGANVTLSACATTTLQKWQVRQVAGGYTVANAASQQFLSVSAGLVNVPVAGEGFKSVPNGRVVQTPADWGKTVWRATSTAGGACSTNDIRPTAISGVSSEQLTGEPAPNGPAAAAIDGNPATYWHTRWAPAAATFPHSIVIDLGSVTSTCGLLYTGRTSSGDGGTNGRIANYDVYASTTVSTVAGAWGGPIASGTFQNNATEQLAAFPTQNARYLKLVAKTEVRGNPWASVGELAAARPTAG